mgnify:CR=1 FL=1
MKRGEYAKMALRVEMEVFCVLQWPEKERLLFWN